MAKNKENLIPLNKRTKEAQREIAKKGAEASNKVQAQKRTFKAIFEALLQDKSVIDTNLTNDQAMAMQMIKEALNGNVKAFEVVRDTVGQKPKDVIESTSNININNPYKELSTEELKKLAGDS